MDILAEALEHLMPPPNEDPSPSERVSASFQRLSSAAAELNRVSDDLSSAIKSIDNKLNRLKIGMPFWKKIHEGKFEAGTLTYELGYAKLAQSLAWGIAIKMVTKSSLGKVTSEEARAFSEWPRDVRLLSLRAIPDLIGDFAQEVSRKAATIKPVADMAKEFVQALEEIGMTDDEVPF